MLKRYFWLAYVVCVTVAAVMAADIAREYAVMRLSEPSVQRSAHTATTGAPAAARMRLAEYAIIAERNVFNAGPPSEAQAPVAAPEVVQPTQLRLRLIGIVAGTSPDRNSPSSKTCNAEARRTSTRSATRYRRLRFVDIQPDCVLLNANQRHEKLCFDYMWLRDQRQQRATGKATAGRPRAVGLRNR